MTLWKTIITVRNSATVTPYHIILKFNQVHLNLIICLKHAILKYIFRNNMAPVVFLLTVPRQFLCCSSSLFLHQWFHMWHLLCHYLFLISPLFGLRKAMLCNCGFSCVSSFIFLTFYVNLLPRIWFGWNTKLYLFWKIIIINRMLATILLGALWMKFCLPVYL